jgi:hypothetical protein
MTEDKDVTSGSSGNENTTPAGEGNLPVPESQAPSPPATNSSGVLVTGEHGTGFDRLVKKNKLPKFARTVIELFVGEESQEAPKSHSEASSSVSHPPDMGLIGGTAPPARTVKKNTVPILAQTILDMEACRQVVGRMITEHEIKVQDLVKTSGDTQPAKCIEKYRRATPCKSKWEDMSGTDRFRLCPECKLYVYDFTQMDIAEADLLVTQRVGTAPAGYYKRKDGKFLASDCPVGVKRGRQTLTSIFCGVSIPVLLLVLALMSPKDSHDNGPAASNQSGSQSAPQAEGKSSEKSKQSSKFAFQTAPLKLDKTPSPAIANWHHYKLPISKSQIAPYADEPPAPPPPAVAPFTGSGDHW